MGKVNFNKKIMLAPGIYTGEYCVGSNGKIIDTNTSNNSGSITTSQLDGYEYMIDELWNDYFVSEDGELIIQE